MIQRKNAIFGTHWYSLIMLMVVVGVISGCATSPYEKEAKTRSDSLLDTQLAKAKSSTPLAKLWFAGFAMHSESRAFRQDVAALGNFLAKIDPNLSLIQLSNPAPGQPTNWPFATPENIERSLMEMGNAMKPEDTAVILLTTHGGVNLLGMNAAGKEYPFIYGQTLTKWLAPLGSRKTIVIVSACYSGSLIPALLQPSRIVLTAAARDRNSFGCQMTSTNTFFIEELLQVAQDTSLSLDQVFDKAIGRISLREQRMRLSPPSSPQKRVAPNMQAFSAQPLNQWLRR
jgi:hypothetical protein